MELSAESNDPDSISYTWECKASEGECAGSWLTNTDSITVPANYMTPGVECIFTITISDNESRSETDSIII